MRISTEPDLPTETQVYEPHKATLPPLGPYFRDLWERRHLAYELARANLRSQNYNTALGQLWLVLNPLFLGLVLFALVTIVRGGSRGPEFLAHLMLGLFAFHLVSMSVNQGAKSVTGGGRLILNMSFPRAILPLEAVMRAFMRFLPAFVVYLIEHVAVGVGFDLQALWGIPILALIIVFSLGMALLAAPAQVYFRDLANFLPYLTRIWLYASPILYYSWEVPERLKPLLAVNPLYPMLGALSEAVNAGRMPSTGYLLASVAWAFGALLVGAYFFLSREREFAVRL
jgi:teichoic acid transport system permease protein